MTEQKKARVHVSKGWAVAKGDSFVLRANDQVDRVMLVGFAPAGEPDERLVPVEVTVKEVCPVEEVAFRGRVCGFYDGPSSPSKSPHVCFRHNESRGGEISLGFDVSNPIVAAEAYRLNKEAEVYRVNQGPWQLRLVESGSEDVKIRGTVVTAALEDMASRQRAVVRSSALGVHPARYYTVFDENNVRLAAKAIADNVEVEVVSINGGPDIVRRVEKKLESVPRKT